VKIGVLAVQGNVREHAAMRRGLGAELVEIRLPEELELVREEANVRT
jgi:pyridoxal 5'-phosphate synthase pdxT subunit